MNDFCNAYATMLCCTAKKLRQGCSSADACTDARRMAHCTRGRRQQPPISPWQSLTHTAESTAEEQTQDCQANACRSTFFAHLNTSPCSEERDFAFVQHYRAVPWGTCCAQSGFAHPAASVKPHELIAGFEVLVLSVPMLHPWEGGVCSADLLPLAAS